MKRKPNIKCLIKVSGHKNWTIESSTHFFSPLVLESAIEHIGCKSPIKRPIMLRSGECEGQSI